MNSSKVNPYFKRLEPPFEDLDAAPKNDEGHSDLRGLRMIHYMGKEGLARFLEEGHVIGPVIRGILVKIVREEKVEEFSKGLNTQIERQHYWWMVMNEVHDIMHFWSVKKSRAIKMLSDANHDLNADTVKKRLRKYRVKTLTKRGSLRSNSRVYSHRDESFSWCRGIFRGLPYPDAFKKLETMAPIEKGDGNH